MEDGGDLRKLSENVRKDTARRLGSRRNDNGVKVWEERRNSIEQVDGKRAAIVTRRVGKTDEIESLEFIESGNETEILRSARIRVGKAEVRTS